MEAAFHLVGFALVPDVVWRETTKPSQVKTATASRTAIVSRV